ncbi:serine hydrolase domain-containing protein [Pseudidiomarina woesei]|uniref:CubicO group peptidase, beta-lactamase class C family n=1 Tax=Pseudidiomarina woesei TaxID=1381080 RepID=A0A0K6HCZ4_9GAMM|nr:serine hydrolase domain-containing protein [Pseudidiomarina woesei]CUA88869.1 CubicO group peptidase, beta-lactamase class C family [Pseudidiomarina woesei]
MTTYYHLIKKLVAVSSILMASAMLFQPAKANNADGALDGLWRGKLEVQPGVALVVGIDVQGETVTLDSPNQGLWGHALSAVTIADGTLTFSAKDLQAEFTGTINGDVIAGTFTQGRARPLTLQRLSNADLEHLKFEGGYAGDLIINGAPQLPLQVNVAVIADSYYASLDSPAQQSYGIPLTNFHIDTETMRFESPMIKASYTGNAEGPGLYSGKFVQGLERKLTLKRLGAAEERVEVPKPKMGEHGGAVAVITPTGVTQKFFADHNAQTTYEIGSVTKTMVAYLLAKSSVEETTNLEQKLKHFFPAAPSSITLEQLATHTSGVPRLPADLFSDANPTDPYAHYNLALLEQALPTVLLGHAGADAQSYEYSNFGYGLLAEALAKAHETNFNQLLTSQLFRPLGMSSSSMALAQIPADETQSAALADGHDALGQVVAPWHFQALAGAGAVRSTLPDMITYVQAMMTMSAEQQRVAQQLFAPRFSMGDCCQQALGWILKQDANAQWFAWHNGQTAGFGAYVGFYLDGSRGIVVLNNQSVINNEYAEQLLTGTAQLHE